MTVEISGPGGGEVAWSLAVPETLRYSLSAEALATELTAATAAVRDGGGGRCRLWIGHVAPGDDALAARWGFRPYRDLQQLRRPLPAGASDLAVRPIGPGDEPAVLALNRRAFARHPEQGDMSAADLRARQSEAWYDPAGFLLHERDGRLAGFCWTKLHPPGPAPPATEAMGEIYVIAVDPDFGGRGIGGALTLAGLGYLHSRGPALAMLYVESDNHPANTVYRRLGFVHHHTNRAYLADL